MNTAQINYLNIGLMLLSTVVAFVIPFELFLFSYAVLGPLHYLTEINWLHKRNYFNSGKTSSILLFTLASALVFAGYIGLDAKLGLGDKLSSLGSHFIFVAFFGALIFLYINNTIVRLVLVSILLFFAFAIDINKIGFAVIFLSILLPTIIHVFLFTGAFMLYGALKSKSKSGLLSMVVFAICAISFFVFVPGGKLYNDAYVVNSYNLFAELNYQLGQLLGLGTSRTVESIFQSNAGLMIMRFIAFAYTYHYLNWFSKTSIIKWHQVKRSTLLITFAIWAISVGIYISSYETGLVWLFFLSFLHVTMEFPLNFRSFIGIGEEMIAYAKNPPKLAP